MRSPLPATRAWAFLACGASAVPLYAVAPAPCLAPLFVLTVSMCIAATVIGVIRNLSRGSRRPWWAIVIAQLGFVGAAILRLEVQGADGLAIFLPDLLVIPSYLLFAYALVAMVRRRRANQDDPARADAVLVGLGAAFALWAFLIAPDIDTEAPTLLRVTSVFFPMLDVLLLVILAHLVIADGIRKPALWLLGASAGIMFASDFVYAIQGEILTQGSPVAKVFDLLFLAGYVAIGTTALHPTVCSLTEPQPVMVRSLSVVRTVGITAVLVVPNILAVLSPPATIWNAAVRVALSVLLTVTIVARIVRANNSRAEAELAARRRATHDALTDLPNRELLADTLTRWCDDATDAGQQISLLFIDLDRFKMINDNWGHSVGDELLCAVAGRLGSLVRGEDLVCRIGGDEFVIALASPSAHTLVESLAERLLVEFTAPFALSVGDVVVTPSIGVARSDGATAALELIRDADTAMYKAKGSGRNAYAFFDASLREKVRTRVGLEQALRGALERGELAVHYQPIIDLATDELSGFEALMRWTHPVLGTISPLEFIPIAEDTGMILRSGAWLLEEAVTQLAEWRAQRPDGFPPLHMSVNLSVRQLRDPELLGVVRRVLAETGVPASALWLEITESGVIEDAEYSLATLRALRALGVTLCIDDFGTGYSSLTYLRQFPAGVVKVDRSFVTGVGQDSGDESIVRTVIAMAHALGLQVVAEGVETVVQRDWLRELGCDLVQGWLYGAPRAASAQLTWMDQTIAAGSA